MNILQLEEKRQQFISNLNIEKCIAAKLVLFNSFFNEILSTNDKSIIESFLSEFEEQYILDLSNFNPIGLEPNFINSIIEISKRILNSRVYLRNREKLRNEIARITKKQEEIKNVLSGKSAYKIKKISFPVNIISTNSPKKFGQIENISIKISIDKSAVKNNFILIPSTQKIDPQLEKQIQVSWDLAVKYLQTKYKRINNNHEVIIILEHKYAHYEGFSLGLALTLGFIQELFKFYNTELNLFVNINTVFTGGIDSEGKIKSVGSEVIKSKVDTVFFSPVNIFALPENDYQAAKEELRLLLQKYPERKLKLVRIEDFEDLINHRKLVIIFKASLAKRAGKYAKKNILLLTLYLLLASVLTFIAIFYSDDNPVEFEQIGNKLNILNIHGNILWSSGFSSALLTRKSDHNYFHRIFDIDNDGINEVILTHEKSKGRKLEDQGRIACFDNKGNLLWKYKFKDTVFTNRDTYKDEYMSRLVDIINIDGINTLICNARHNYFPSAIYKLDIRTGKRLPGTLWSQGHFTSGQIGDFNKDGDPEIFIGGVNNGRESAFALITKLKNLKGQTPSIKSYLFKNIPIGNFTKYFLFKKTDICRLFENRYNGTVGTFFRYDVETYNVGVDEGYPNILVGPVYVINQTLDSAWLQIGDDLQFIRDSLIIKGKLTPPFTNDKLYEEILISGIKEWNGQEFVPFKRK